ncbi:MAG: DivIVA domain-containing protein [Firmicutes bacterium]|nr:DivIVA domain-containing protein [Bacillota bacterium]
MLKPMDIHNAEFKRTFKGYDPEEVDDFLANIVIKYETVYQENRKLHEEIKKLREQLEGQEHQEQDILDLISLTKQTVQEAKTVARQEADNVVNVAQSEAERIMVEARLKAQQLLADAEERLQKTERAERQLRDKIRLTMETIWNVLVDDGVKPEATRLYREVSKATLQEELLETSVATEE